MKNFIKSMLFMLIVTFLPIGANIVVEFITRVVSAEVLTKSIIIIGWITIIYLWRKIK